MRRLRYQVACSLDGYIAGGNDEFDWIPPEPAFDFQAHFDQFDILLMGRRTYEIVRNLDESFKGKHIIVASSSLKQADHPDVEIVNEEGLRSKIEALKSQPGRDIWLYGGGQLFSKLLEWDLVDTFEPAYIPVLLGGGVPIHTPNGLCRSLKFMKQKGYASGMILIEYEVLKLNAKVQ